MKNLRLLIIILVSYNLSCKSQTIIKRGDTIITIQDNNYKKPKIAKYPNKNLKESKLCKLLDSINKNDQLYRYTDSFTKTYMDIAYKILDSVYNANDIAFFPDNSGRRASKNLTMKEKLKYSDITTKILHKRYPELTKEKWKKRQDSIGKLQIALDNKNTEMLINIIKKYGYPNKSNCDCKEETINRLAVFRHSQPQYFDTIKKLITIEKNQGRLNETSYKVFLDHINGRTGKDL